MCVCVCVCMAAAQLPSVSFSVADEDSRGAVTSLKTVICSNLPSRAVVASKSDGKPAS